MDAHKIRELAASMRRKILDISHRCNMSAHLGGGLSIVEITATLYGAVMRFDPKRPDWHERDRFILSKGHGVLGYFTALHAVGLIPDEVLDTFQTNESPLIAHPVMNLDLGIESSNGSLGQGLSMAVGMALGARKRGRANRVYVLLGDGECNEGSVWEAAMSAAHYQLDNLVAIVDRNRFQSDGDGGSVMNSDDMQSKWASFGWDAERVDGHDVERLYAALTRAHRNQAPKVLVAETVKGKGVAFMENNNEWHHNRLTKTHYERALLELG